MEFNHTCDLCPLSEGAISTCMEPVMGGSPKIMIVVDYPSVEEDKSGDSFSDQPLLAQLLFEVLDIPKNDIYLTYLAKCRPLGNNTASNHFTVCREEYFKKEIEEVKPLSIILMGGDVAESVLGKSIKSLRGSVHSFEGCPTVATYSVSMGRKDPEILELIAKDIQQGYSIAFGAEVVESDTVIVEVEDGYTLDKLIEHIKAVGGFAFDFETTGLDIHAVDFYPTALSISFQPGVAYVIPLFHFEKDNLWVSKEHGKINNYLIDALREVFLDFRIYKVAHNAKFDGNILKRFFGYWLEGRYDDTMTMHHCLYNNEKHSLEVIVDAYFPPLRGYKNETKRYKWTEVPWEVLKNRNGVDADATLRLHIVFEGELLDKPQEYIAYRNIMAAALRPLMEAEYEGSLIDIEHINEGIAIAERRQKELLDQLYAFPQVGEYNRREQKVQNTKIIKELQAKIDGGAKAYLVTRYEERIKKLKSGEEQVFDKVNFASPLQLKELLFGPNGFRFSRPIDERWKKPIDNTEADTLGMIEDSTGFINALLNYRGVGKVLSTYLIGIRDRLDINGRIHGKFHQPGAATFRMSSMDPNLQNMISRSDFTDVLDIIAYVKGSFIPPAGHIILNVDFSQMELRIIAHFADEDTMLQAYRDGLDLHIITAADDHRMTVEEFYQQDKDTQKKQRYEAKASNFGFIYGLSAEGFVEYAKNKYGIILTKSQAIKHRTSYFHKYSKLLKYHSTIIAKAEKYGYVRTLFGSRINLPDIYHPSSAIKAHAERNAINGPIQGTGGQFGVFDIALLYRRLDPRVRLFNTVHDSIMYYVPYDLIQETVDIVRSTSENLPVREYFGVTFDRVQLKVDVEASTKSWKGLEPIDNLSITNT